MKDMKLNIILEKESHIFTKLIINLKIKNIELYGEESVEHMEITE